MSEVGIRQLRDNLSKYVSQVREGGEVVITDHGRAVARIVSVNRRPIDRLIEEGVVTPSDRSKADVSSRRIHPAESISDLVADQRR